MNIKWNAEDYKNGFSFVPQYGEDVMSLITAKEGSTVLDLGCGNGTLTAKLAEKGYSVLGIDDSAEMLALAVAEHPEIEFRKGNALDFLLEKKADVIFSNAVFHWIDEKDQDTLIANIAKNLKTGGELVCEFGGYGCAEMVHSALESAFARRGLKYERTFYFPTIGEYAPMLEEHGLRVEYATLFDRPTEQKGENGLYDWINMFVKKPFEGMDEETKEEILFEVMISVVGDLYKDGKWFIDYVRLRIRARKVDEHDLASILHEMCPNFRLGDLLD
ncbi:MAG: methyltransferase domain-containing protein [Clostridia bacterium]|nr:methyltransferase domain-containing protein [Clostridia bacterium]